MPWFVTQVVAFRSFILRSAVYPGKDAALSEGIKPAKPVTNGKNASLWQGTEPAKPWYNAHVTLFGGTLDKYETFARRATSFF